MILTTKKLIHKIDKITRAKDGRIHNDNYTPNAHWDYQIDAY